MKRIGGWALVVLFFAVGSALTILLGRLYDMAWLGAVLGGAWGIAIGRDVGRGVARGGRD